MFVIGNFLGAIASVLDIVLQGLMLVIFINAVLSWVRSHSSRTRLSRNTS